MLPVESTSAKIYMKNEDPYTFTRQYIESSPNLSFCYESSSPRALGFIRDIGSHISKHHECSEVLIDSTHSKFELFCAIVKLFGMSEGTTEWSSEKYTGDRKAFDGEVYIE